MPKIGDFIPKASTKKGTKSSWDLSDLSRPLSQPTVLQRRPGRGDDAPLLETPAKKVDTNRTQSGHKPSTNQHQSDSKPDTKWTQTEHKPDTKNSFSRETEHKVDTQPDTGSDTNRTQSGHKPDTKSAFSELVGLQRSVQVFIYEACKEARSTTTNPITIEHLASSIGANILSMKTTLRRLEKKKLLTLVEFKNGRGGSRRYSIPEEIFREMLQLETGHKLNTNRAQTGHKLNTQPDTEPSTSLSSSSSYLNIKGTTTTGGDHEPLFDPGRVQLAPQWLALDLEPLAGIGFTQTHLVQIVSQAKLSPELVQDSIHHFAFDLRVNGKGRDLKGPPINYFMGILRKGFPYAAPENYLAPHEEALKRFHESKRAAAERAQAAENALYEAELEEWASGLPSEEKSRLGAPGGFKGGIAERAKLAIHFKKNVWPEIRSRIINQTSRAAITEATT